jgi:hypothetical protein
MNYMSSDACRLQDKTFRTELCQVDLNEGFVKTTTAADGICVRFLTKKTLIGRIADINYDNFIIDHT